MEKKDIKNTEADALNDDELEQVTGGACHVTVGNIVSSNKSEYVKTTKNPGFNSLLYEEKKKTEKNKRNFI